MSLPCLLPRYVFSRHAALMLIILGAGIALYLLTDLVERLDSFVDAGTSLFTVLSYFGLKLPSIAAQILPAVFILASVITLCLLARNRELLALEAGGVNPSLLAAILVFCGLLWGAAQLGCSQFLGTAGLIGAERLWDREVHDLDDAAAHLRDLWFSDGTWLVSVRVLYQDGRGEGFNAYELSDDGLRFVSIARGPRFLAEPGRWSVSGADRFSPDSFASENNVDLVLPIATDPRMFFVAGQEKPQNQPLWLLSAAIAQLRDSGSNVEALVTAWHSRLAYAASLMVMAVLAVAVVSWKRNIYLAVGLSIAVTFLFHVLTVTGQTMGEKGILPPVLAAWGPQILLLSLAALRLAVVNIRHA